MTNTSVTGRQGGDAQDALWRALADPTRRALLDQLREGPATTGALSAAFAMTRFGIMKHLNVLSEAGLVMVERRGRERWNYLNPVPIQQIARRWIRPYESAVADQLIELKHVAEARHRARKRKQRNA